MDKETFVWKSDGKIFKGVGIYHLTFVVAGRRKLLGEIVGVNTMKGTTMEWSLNTNANQTTTNVNQAAANANQTTTNADVKDKARMAWVKLTPFGKAVDDVLRHYDLAHEGIKVCKRKVLDDHIHVVLWMRKQQYSTVQHKPQSILQIAYGMRVQFTHIAQELGVWPKGVRVEGALHAEKGAGHVFEKQFVRTLSRSGQLREMIDYVELNVYRKYMRCQHPDLFTMHKDTAVEGLRFRSMGNHWLLDWPERQMVECSRSISEEDLLRLQKQILEHAEHGAVTYTAAISKGEQRIARAVREAGWPLVVLLMDGFPPEGNENEKYYKPGGVYFDTCLDGKLLLLEACHETYNDPRLIDRTDASIKAKDEAKGYCYRPLAHDSKRWRMIAGNEMLRMLNNMAEEIAEER